jgi:hypothetical protein
MEVTVRRSYVAQSGEDGAAESPSSILTTLGRVTGPKLPLPPGEAKVLTSRLRPWAEAADGKPVYMVNLIHYYPQLHTYPGAPEFQGTPQQSNAYYTEHITWLWLRHAAYPVLDGATQGENLIGMQPTRKWDQVTVARYPNRRGST